MMPKQYLQAGKIVNKRGLSGELKVDNYCDSPDVFEGLHTLYLDDKGDRPVKVLSCKWYKGYAYVLLEGITTPEAADALRNRFLYADRADIPLNEGDTFIDDLIGLAVYDADTGRVYGRIAEVFNRGASDLYRIVADGKEFFMPAVKEFVIAVDTQKGVAVRPIPGMFDDAEEIRS